MTDLGHARALLSLIENGQRLAREHEDATWLVESGHTDQAQATKYGWVFVRKDGKLGLTKKGRDELKRQRRSNGRFAKKRRPQ